MNVPTLQKVCLMLAQGILLQISLPSGPYRASRDSSKSDVWCILHVRAPATPSAEQVEEDVANDMEVPCGPWRLCVEGILGVGVHGMVLHSRHPVCVCIASVRTVGATWVSHTRQPPVVPEGVRLQPASGVCRCLRRAGQPQLGCEVAGQLFISCQLLLTPPPLLVVPVCAARGVRKGGRRLPSGTGRWGALEGIQRHRIGHGHTRRPAEPATLGHPPATVPESVFCLSHCSRQTYTWKPRQNSDMVLNRASCG